MTFPGGEVDTSGFRTDDAPTKTTLSDDTAAIAEARAFVTGHDRIAELRIGAGSYSVTIGQGYRNRTGRLDWYVMGDERATVAEAVRDAIALAEAQENLVEK